MDIPKKCKAIVYDQPGKISTKLEEVDVPEPGNGEILVKITHSGVCHSDYGVMTNSWPWLPFPTQAGQVGGHEGVGTIAKFGPGCEGSQLKEGQRVGIKWISYACLSCPPCQSGFDAGCHSARISGYYTPGTFQQYTLAPAHYATPIPDGLPSDTAAPMLCGGVTVYSALKKSRAQPGDFVVVSGAGGGLGHLALQIGGKGMGFRMIGVDAGSKESLARECGAEAFFDITKYEKGEAGTKKLADDIKSVTDGNLGAAAVIVCTASNAAYAQGLDFLRFNGTMVCVGIPEGEFQAIASANPSLFVIKQLNVVGSAVGSRKEAIETLEMAKRGVVSTRFRTDGMEALGRVFEEMERGEVKGRVVLDLWA